MEYPSYLVHWKYIRKYRKNGKWRYVYADKYTHRGINDLMDESDNYVSEAAKNAALAERKARFTQGLVTWSNPDPEAQKQARIYYKKAADNSVKSSISRQKAYDLIDKYSDTKVSRILEKIKNR